MRLKHRFIGTLSCCLLFVAAQACRSPFASGGNANGASASSLVVMNAPASGTVRRVLVSEGVTVEEGATVLEIVVSTSGTAQSLEDDASARARVAAQAAQSQVTAAQRDVERARVEVQRVEGLVATNAVSQPDLDAARAVYQRAQEDAQAQRSDAGRAQDQFILQSGTQQTSAVSTTREQIVPVKATASGTLRVISVRSGQSVTAGQPIATLSVSSR